MATYTTNYNLKKIALTDSPPDITELNGNFDTIDSALHDLDKWFFATYDPDVPNNCTPYADIAAAVDANKKVLVTYADGFVTCFFSAYTRTGSTRTGCYFNGVRKTNGTGYPEVVKLILTTGNVWTVETYPVATRDYVDDNKVSKAVSSNTGNLMQFDSNGNAADSGKTAAALDQVFIVTYGATGQAPLIKQAWDANKAVFCKYNENFYTLSYKVSNTKWRFAKIYSYNTNAPRGIEIITCDGDSWSISSRQINDSFIATYNSTTKAEIDEAYDAGKTIYVCYPFGTDQFYYMPLAECDLSGNRKYKFEITVVGDANKLILYGVQLSNTTWSKYGWTWNVTGVTPPT